MTEFLIGLTGAIFGSSITFLIAQRRLHSENVVKERALWREKIRSLADELATVKGPYKNDQIRRQLAMNLNITQLMDREILRIARIHPRSLQQNDQLTDSLSLLLKHD